MWWPTALHLPLLVFPLPDVPASTICTRSSSLHKGLDLDVVTEMAPKTTVPPRAKPPKAVAKMKKLMQDEKELEAAEAFGEGLLFYDKNSPSVRKRRANARAFFESYCAEKLGKENPTEAEM